MHGPGGERRVVLLCVAVLHIAIAWLWLAWAPSARNADTEASTVFMQLLEPLRPKPALPKVATPLPRPVAPTRPLREKAPAPERVAAVPAQTAEHAVAQELPAPAVEPVASELDADAITIQAKRDAVMWDRATNKDRLKGITSFEDRPFARAIAGAFKPRSGITTTRQYVSGDGRRITKVISPHGTYCVISLENNSIMSETLGRQGATTRKIACPKD